MTGEGMSHQATSPVAVVTGGCGDIGRAVGLRLARDGFAVVLADLLDVSTGEAIASELSRAQPQAPALRRLTPSIFCYQPWLGLVRARALALAPSLSPSFV